MADSKHANGGNILSGRAEHSTFPAHATGTRQNQTNKERSTDKGGVEEVDGAGLENGFGNMKKQTGQNLGGAYRFLSGENEETRRKIKQRALANRKIINAIHSLKMRLTDIKESLRNTTTDLHAARNKRNNLTRKIQDSSTRLVDLARIQAFYETALQQKHQVCKEGSRSRDRGLDSRFDTEFGEILNEVIRNVHKSWRRISESHRIASYSKSNKVLLKTFAFRAWRRQAQNTNRIHIDIIESSNHNPQPIPKQFQILQNWRQATHWNRTLTRLSQPHSHARPQPQPQPQPKPHLGSEPDPQLQKARGPVDFLVRRRCYRTWRRVFLNVTNERRCSSRAEAFGRQYRRRKVFNSWHERWTRLMVERFEKDRRKSTNSLKEDQKNLLFVRRHKLLAHHQRKGLIVTLAARKCKYKQTLATWKTKQARLAVQRAVKRMIHRIQRYVLYRWAQSHRKGMRRLRSLAIIEHVGADKNQQITNTLAALLQTQRQNDSERTRRYRRVVEEARVFNEEWKSNVRHSYAHRHFRMVILAKVFAAWHHKMRTIVDTSRRIFRFKHSLQLGMLATCVQAWRVRLIAKKIVIARLGAVVRWKIRASISRWRAHTKQAIQAQRQRQRNEWRASLLENSRLLHDSTRRQFRGMNLRRISKALALISHFLRKRACRSLNRSLATWRSISIQNSYDKKSTAYAQSLLANLPPLPGEDFSNPKANQHGPNSILLSSLPLPHSFPLTPSSSGVTDLVLHNVALMRRPGRHVKLSRPPFPSSAVPRTPVFARRRARHARWQRGVRRRVLVACIQAARFRALSMGLLSWRLFCVRSRRKCMYPFDARTMALKKENLKSLARKVSTSVSMCKALKKNPHALCEQHQKLLKSEYLKSKANAETLTRTLHLQEERVTMLRRKARQICRRLAIHHAKNQIQPPAQQVFRSKLSEALQGTQ